MRKASKSSTLSLNLGPSASGQLDDFRGPRSPRSPRSPPSAGLVHTIYSNGASSSDTFDPHAVISSVQITQSPTSPGVRKDSKSFFSGYKSSRLSDRLRASESSIRQVSDDSVTTPSTSQVYQYRKSPGSTPELSLCLENASITSDTSSQNKDHDQRPTGGTVKSNSVPHLNPDLSGAKRSQPKHRFPQILNRSRSIRTEEPIPRNKLKSSTSQDYREPEYEEYEGKGKGKQRKPSKHMDVPGLRTAPLEKDRSFRDMMNSTIRNRSADRNGTADSDDERLSAPKEGREGLFPSNSFNERGGSSFLSNIKHSGTRAADGIGKAGKGIFSKLARSGSSTEKEQPAVEREHVLRTIRLPLIEQTRKTRISKRLETSKDKTEFWMPALPWRCIDYLNGMGTEEEGLYRIPGSEKDVAYWQMRFDTENDINLFDEKDLYDINIITTLFKRWLSSIPDEIFPKSTQARIAAECKNATKTPQLLKDELSKLPPYNYYLLFAITCHISLLHSCSERNKMNYHNLCICFQPCMKMDAFVFQFLVLDWRNCWQGCWTEKEYLLEEQRYAEALQQSSSSLQLAQQRKGSQSSSTNYISERAVSSSESSKLSITRSSTPEKRLPPSNASRAEQSVEGEAKPSQGSRLKVESENSPSLAPLKPLSPIGSL